MLGEIALIENFAKAELDPLAQKVLGKNSSDL